MTRTTKRTLPGSITELANRASHVLLTRTASKQRNENQPQGMPIRSGHCSRCNVRIPSGQLQHALAGKTIQCEHCHSVLYAEAG